MGRCSARAERGDILPTLAATAETVMRWYILKALLQKEFARHLANRGGITLALLLVAAAALLSVFTPKQSGTVGTDLVGGVHHCRIVFDKDDERLVPLRNHLAANRPPELDKQLVVEAMDP